jgi:hypothetical protein
LPESAPFPDEFALSLGSALLFELEPLRVSEFLVDPESLLELESLLEPEPPPESEPLLELELLLEPESFPEELLSPDLDPKKYE